MLTGSFASSFQGEPLSTHDIDFVVALSAASIPILVSEFPPPEFYLDQASIESAIRLRGTFNLLHASEGDKVDFWMMTNSAFDMSRFSRRKHQEVFGIPVMMSTPEDTILVKLNWAKESGGSEKQFVDALRVYEVQHGNLDMDHLTDWVKKLEIDELWNRLIQEAIV